MTDNFCQLHCHSSYSFKDGLAAPGALVAQAAELGQPGIGLTDHGVLFGAPMLFKACAEHGVKGVIGMEIYEAVPFEIENEAERFKAKYSPDTPRYFHLTLWAMNRRGWENLCALHTLSFTAKHKPKNQPLIDKASLELFSDGLIVGTGCPASRMNWTLTHQGVEAATKEAEWYFEVFGDRAYVEVMGNLPEQQAALRPQRQIAKHFGRPAVAVNDVHYMLQSDGVEHGPHHTLVQARKFKSAATSEEKTDDKSDDSYGDWYGSDEFFLKNRAQMQQTGFMAAELDTTLEILGRTDFSIVGLEKPKAPHWVPEPGEDPEFDAYLAAA